VNALAGSSAFSASLNLPGGASCSFTVNVTGVAEGAQVNTASATAQFTATFSDTVTASASIFVGPALQVSYAANLGAGESFVNLTNSGSSGAPLLGPGFAAVGNICANVYAFSPDEQLISCCSCLITPNGLANLGVTRNLTANTLTQTVPNSIVIKIVTSLAGPGGSGTSCTNSAANVTTAQLAGSALAWGTTLHSAPAGAFRVTETPFRGAALSAGELASITGRCASIVGNGSGHGICSSCQAGGLGVSNQ
jgi:hypothetical protein